MRRLFTKIKKVLNENNINNKSRINNIKFFQYNRIFNQ
jgi:16S rRNA A1518/A1519 N6-dimethyltransferase RsmA/KsgA/DIM1 with predicted DNA glycosylase/AP lyase activity